MFWKFTFNNLSHGACVLSHFSCAWLFSTPCTIAHQALLFMEFSKQEYWSGLLFDSPEDLPNPGIETRSPALQAESLPPRKPPRKLHDKTRQHIKKQRHHIADKGPYIHSYGFPSIHVQMSVLNHKKGWGPKQLILLISGAREDSQESLGQQGYCTNES